MNCGIPDAHPAHVYRNFRGTVLECDGVLAAYAASFDDDDLLHEAEHGGWRDDEYDPAIHAHAGSFWERETHR